jgi:hypothetical protein
VAKKVEHAQAAAVSSAPVSKQKTIRKLNLGSCRGEQRLRVYSLLPLLMSLERKDPERRLSRSLDLETSEDLVQSEYLRKLDMWASPSLVGRQMVF